MTKQLCKASFWPFVLYAINIVGASSHEEISIVLRDSSYNVSRIKNFVFLLALNLPSFLYLKAFQICLNVLSIKP